MRTLIAPKPTPGKLLRNKFLTYILHSKPFRGEIVEVDIKVVNKRIVYSYKKVREA